ncbi:BrnA antitoxin family protein [Candidatus Electronema sp. JC]|uniref:BrnA antitoxin family protein n=1 Tax=Candidatus Electronema sp. JC TaxID=3401570 RepID=UPI003AA9BA15
MADRSGGCGHHAAGGERRHVAGRYEAGGDEAACRLPGAARFGQAKRGRPPKSRAKQSTTLRLSAEVLEFFKAGGKG